MIVDALRNGYQKPMRFWQGDSATVKVTWYVANPGAQVLPYETQFASTNWDDDSWTRPLGETRGPSRVYELGNNVLGYSGTRSCGSAETWANGGIHGSTPEIVAGPNGACACCGPLVPINMIGSGSGFNAAVFVSRRLGTGTGGISTQWQSGLQPSNIGSGTGGISSAWLTMTQTSEVGSGTGSDSEQFRTLTQTSEIGSGTGGSSSQAFLATQTSEIGSGTGGSSSQAFAPTQTSEIGSGTGGSSEQGTDMPLLGEYRMFFSSTPPIGWLLCNGGSFNSGTYAALATLLGDTFGMHSGSTYYLPFFGGRVPVAGGISGGTSSRVPGNYGGVETVQLSANESGVPAHNHPPSGFTYFQGTNGAVGGGTGPSLYTSNAVAAQTGDNSAAGAAVAHENMQPWLCAGYIMIFAGP